jgi:uncharacterized protein
MKRKSINLSILSMLIVASASVFASPSFDCAKTSTSVEKTICGSETLQKLDSALASNYRDMLEAGDDLPGGAKDLKQDQKAWVAKRNVCTSEKCLADMYRTRIDEICDIPMVKGVHPNCISSEDIK